MSSSSDAASQEAIPAEGEVMGVRPAQPAPETEPVSESARPSSVRIDKWLWAARMFKTRSQASKACTAGHVKLNGESVKASKPVRRGDHLEVQTRGGLRIVDVLLLSDKRGPASVARTLYEDHTPPPPPKEERTFAVRERGAGRPEKKDRRLLIRLRGR